MEKISVARIALKWGLISSVVSVVFTTILYNTSLWEYSSLGILISTVLTFGVLYFSMNEFKTINNGFLSFNEGLSLGTLTIATSSILSLLYDFIYKKYIDPNLLALQMEKVQEQYESMGMSEEQIEKSIEKANQYLNSGFAFIIGVFTVILIGFLCSLIMAAILKKDKPVFS
jgi:zinc transporter ZupT